MKGAQRRSSLKMEREKSSEDFEMMVERLLLILSDYPSGAKDHLVAAKYLQRFSTELPANWVKTLKDVPEIDAIQGIGDAALLYAPKAATVAEAAEARPRRTRFALDMLQVREYQVVSSSSSTDDAEATPSPDTEPRRSPKGADFSDMAGFRPREMSSFLRQAEPEGRMRQTARILTAYSPSLVYARLADSVRPLARLNDQLETFYETEGRGSHVRSFPRSREVYAARVDGAWRRVLVGEGGLEESSRTSKPPSPEQLAQSLSLFLVDEGSYEVASVADLRELDSEFLAFPMLAVPVSIKTLEHISDSPDASTRTLTSLTKDTDLDMLFLMDGNKWERGRDTSFNVMLESIHIPLEMSPEAFFDELKESLDVKRAAQAAQNPSLENGPTGGDKRLTAGESRPTKSDNPPTEADETKAGVPKLPTKTEKQSTRKESQPTKQKWEPKKPECQPTLSSRPALKDLTPNVTPKTENNNGPAKSRVRRIELSADTDLSALRIDTNCNVVAESETMALVDDEVEEDSEARLSDLSSFAAQRPSDLVPMELPASRAFPVFVTFAPDPSEFSFQLKSCWPMPDYVCELLQRELVDSEPLLQIQPNTFYAGWDEEASRWERVFVSEPLSATPLVGVFKVDCGEYGAVRRSSLRQLPASALVVREMLALKGRLDLLPLLGQHWPQAAANAFARKVSCQFLRAEWVGPAAKWGGRRAPGLPLLSLRLFDEGGRDVADWMREKGHARPLD